MWYFSDAAIMEFIGRYFWPMVRISALFMAMPIIGTKIVTARVRIVLAFSVSLLVTPLLPPLPVVPLLSLQSFMIILHQVVIGLTIGFFLQVLFQIFVLAGQFIAMKMGLGFAAMNDPASGVSVTVLSQFYLIVTTLLFLSLNGHLVVIELIVSSFTTLPISEQGLSTDVFWELAASGGWLFSKAMLVSLPILTALLIVNMAFGVMSRVAPQMNVFAVGFPVTLVFGLFLIWVGLVNLLPNFVSFVDDGFSVLHNILRIP